MAESRGLIRTVADCTAPTDGGVTFMEYSTRWKPGLGYRAMAGALPYPARVVFSGGELAPSLMGRYEWQDGQDMANGSPLYVKRDAAGAAVHWLYRGSASGTWILTRRWEDLASERGEIAGTLPSFLPTEPGLQFKVHLDNTWPVDATIRVTDLEFPSLVPCKVSISGSEATPNSCLFGTYERQLESVNGAPLFCKATVEPGKQHFLFRTSTAGLWMATDSRDRMAQHPPQGGLQSSRAADLPCNDGLSYHVFSGQSWVPDPSIRVSPGSPPAPEAITLGGHTGPHAALMGRYELQPFLVNGAPLYMLLQGEGSDPFFLFRTVDFLWVVTDVQMHLSLCRGHFVTTRTAFLPSPRERWNCHDPNTGWAPDQDLRAKPSTSWAVPGERGAADGVDVWRREHRLREPGEEARLDPGTRPTSGGEDER
uniref:Uncharacterized protein n=1 Tax=Rhizochromulina marina TaxID=1034831 RepID=A0A7S2S968_9STRA